jgi:hypothetical protein
MVNVSTLWDTTPVVSPLSGGVLDHADIVENLSGPVPPSGAFGLSFNCLETAVPTALCPEVTEPKDFNGPGTIDGFDFAVYGGLSCKGFGFDEETGLQEIERVFALKESRGVERALMETRFTLGPDDDPGAGVVNRWPAATDITPAGGAVPAKVGLALLEGFAAAQYSGQPTLHIPYSVGSLLAGDQIVVAEGGKFYTRLGAKAAVGPGYEFPNNDPAGDEADAGTRWLYASGEVMVARSALRSFALPDQYTNDIYALAERRYIVAIDCFAAAIQVSVE